MRAASSVRLQSGVQGTLPHALERELTVLITYEVHHSVWIENSEIRPLGSPELELRDSTQILLAADHCQIMPAREVCNVIPLLLLQASFIPHIIAPASEVLPKATGLCRSLSTFPLLSN